MKTYRERTQPKANEYIFIYRIAQRLRDSGITKDNYTRDKAKQIMLNSFLPEYSYRTINKYSNHIIKEL